MSSHEQMTAGELRDKIKDVLDDTPIDFGCQCDSFDKWEARIETKNIYSTNAYLGFYLIRGKNNE